MGCPRSPAFSYADHARVEKEKSAEVGQKAEKEKETKKAEAKEGGKKESYFQSKGQKVHLEFTRSFFRHLKLSAPAAAKSVTAAGGGEEKEALEVGVSGWIEVKRGRKEEKAEQDPRDVIPMRNKHDFSDPNVNCILNNAENLNSINMNGPVDKELLRQLQSQLPKRRQNKDSNPPPKKYVHKKSPSKPPTLAVSTAMARKKFPLQRTINFMRAFSNLHMRWRLKEGKQKTGTCDASSVFGKYYRKGFENFDISGKYIVNTLLLNGQRTQSFLDTGADTCIVSKQLLTSLGIDIEAAKKVPGIKLYSYSGDLIPTYEAIWLKLGFLGKKFEVPHLFLMTNYKSEMVVLSKMFLRTYQVDILWKKGRCKMILPNLGDGAEKGKKSNKTVQNPELPPPSPPPFTRKGAPSSTSTNRRPKERREEVDIQFEQNIFKVSNLRSFDLPPYGSALIPVQLHGEYVPANIQKIMISPFDGDAKAVKFSPSLSPRCKCQKNCWIFIAEVCNYSNLGIKINAKKLWGRAEEYLDSMSSVIEAKTILATTATGSPSIPARFFRRLAGENGMRVTVNVLTQKEEEEGTYDVTEGNKELFRQSLPWATIDTDTGLPLEPFHYKCPQDAIDWTKYPSNVVPYIKTLLCDRHSSIISRGPLDIGNASRKGIGKVDIPTIGPPKKAKSYPLSQTKSLSLLKILRGLTTTNILKRVVSAHGSPIFVINKRDPNAQGRLLINLVNVNAICLNAPAALLTSPLETLQKLGQSAIFSQLDLKQAFSHLELSEEASQKIVLSSPFGQFKITRMPQGLLSSPSLFLFALNKVLYDDPRTGHLEQLSPPEEYEGAAMHENPFSNLSFFCHSFVDDIIVATPQQETEEKTMEFHSIVLSRIFGKFQFYDLKINIQKCELFKQQISALGFEIEKGKLTPSKNRFEDIQKAKFPTSRNSTLSFCSLVNTLRHCLSIKCQELLSHFYDLTSVNKPFSPQPHHYKAFREIKDELLREPLVSYIPDPSKCKLLFTDASTTLLGAVLLEIDFKEAIKTKEEVPKIQGRSFSIYDSLGRKIFRTCKEKEIQLSPVDTPADGNCFLHAVLDQLKLYEIKNYPENVDDFRFLLCTFLRSHNKLREESRPVREALGGVGWHSLIDSLRTPNTPTDTFNVMLRGMADLLGRDIYIITDDQKTTLPIKILSTTKTLELPPIFLGYYHPGERTSIGHYQSIIVNSKNPLSDSSFTSFSKEKQWRDLSQEELFEQVRKLWRKKATERPGLRVLGYMTKTLNPADAKEPIHVLELKSLLESLFNFREMVLSCPTCICLVDSRALWCVLSRSLSETCLKVHRWAVSIRQKYPNLMFMLVKSHENISDFLSRQFKPIDCDPSRMVLKEFKRPVTELENAELLTFDEAEKIVEKNPQYITEAIEPKPKKKEKTMYATVHATQLDRLSEILLPLQQLKDKLSPSAIASRQKEELTEDFKFAQTIPTRRQPGNHKLEIINGLLMLWSKEEPTPRIYVPPSLEGLAISYEHLISAHRLGRLGLWMAMKNLYYFPNMRTKIYNFVSLCLNCSLVHGISSRRAPLGKTPLPSRPMQVIYLDILTLAAKSPKIPSDFLVLVDPFSKYVLLYPCLKMNDATIIQHLKSFFTHFGLRTNYVISDNASYFRSASYVRFLTVLGINVVYSSAWASKARGQVEIVNFLLTKALRAMLLTKSDYKFNEILFIINNMLNNTLNLSTKHSPSEVIFGEHTLSTDAMGIYIPKVRTSSPLINSSLAADVKLLRSALNKIWAETKKNLETVREKMAQRYNKHKRVKNLEVGDLCFILDRRQPAPGTNKKLAPPLQPSPYMIEAVRSHSVDVVRLVDRFRTRLHPDAIKLFKNMASDDPLFSNLPSSVRTELGRPLTAEQLRALAIADDLPLLFVENFNRYQKGSGSGVETRAARRKRELEEQAIKQAFRDGEEEEEEWEWLKPGEDDDDLEVAGVSFDDDK